MDEELNYTPITEAERAEMKKLGDHNYLVYTVNKEMDKVALAIWIPNLAVGFYAGYMHAAGQPVDAPWLIGSVGATATVQGIESIVRINKMESEENKLLRFDEAFWVSAAVATAMLGLSYAAGAITQKALNFF